MIKLISEFGPSVIVITVVVLLGSFLGYKLNRSQKLIMESVTQAQVQQQRIDATLEAIRKQMNDEESWEKVEKSLRANK